MTNREQFLELEKLVKKISTEKESYFEEQNKILRELISTKDALHNKYLSEHKDLKEEIHSLKTNIADSIEKNDKIIETWDKHIGRFTSVYLFIISFGMISLFLYGLSVGY